MTVRAEDPTEADARRRRHRALIDAHHCARAIGAAISAAATGEPNAALRDRLAILLEQAADLAESLRVTRERHDVR